MTAEDDDLRSWVFRQFEVFGGMFDVVLILASTIGVGYVIVQTMVDGGVGGLVSLVMPIVGVIVAGVAGLVLAFAVMLTALYVVFSFENRKRPDLPRVISGAARLLPVDHRSDYQEEWAAWMLDLRSAGTPRSRRWFELLTIVFLAIPRLAVTLRLAARAAAKR